MFDSIASQKSSSEFNQNILFHFFQTKQFHIQTVGELPFKQLININKRGTGKMEMVFCFTEALGK